jgi:hypothetical protein
LRIWDLTKETRAGWKSDCRQLGWRPDNLRKV